MKRKPNRIGVVDMGHDTPCHVWLLAKNAKGYGVVKHKGRCRRAHIVYWEEANGPVPDKHVLDHLCNVRLCVREDHMEPVTQKENLRRMRERDPERAQAHMIRMRELSAEVRRKAA